MSSAEEKSSKASTYILLSERNISVTTYRCVMCMYVYIYVCMYVYVHVCVYVYMYIYE